MPKNNHQNHIITAKTKKALKQQGVVLAYLFGSEAKGFTHKDSDVDIAVLLHKKIRPNQYFNKCLRLPGLFSGEFTGRERVVTVINEASPLLKREILAGGKLMYCLNDQARADFIRQTVREYEDTKSLRNIQYHYLKERIMSGQY